MVEGAIDGVEDAVDEGDGVVAGVAAGELEGFVDDDGGGEGALHEFKDSEAEDVAIDGGHAFEAPMLRVSGDFFVDGGEAIEGAAGEFFEEAVTGETVLGEIVGGVERMVEVAQGFLDSDFAEVALEEDLERAFAGFAAAGHQDWPRSFARRLAISMAVRAAS